VKNGRDEGGAVRRDLESSAVQSFVGFFSRDRSSTKAPLKIEAERGSFSSSSATCPSWVLSLIKTRLENPRDPKSRLPPRRGRSQSRRVDIGPRGRILGGHSRGVFARRYYSGELIFYSP
jgi:hypothetical protein